MYKNELAPLSVDTMNTLRCFVPISIGNHYYSKAVLRQILDQTADYSNASIIFICDRLRVLSHMGRLDLDEPEARAKVKLEIDQTYKTLINCGIEQLKNIGIETWNLLEQDACYPTVLQGLENLCTTDSEVESFVVKLAEELKGKVFHHYGRAERLSTIQRQYILEETALSLFMTEIYEFNVELYRRHDRGLIVFLYEQKKEQLQRLLNKSQLSRVFVSLEELFASKMPIIDFLRTIHTGVA